MEATSIGQFVEYLTRMHQRTRRVAACIDEATLEWCPGEGRWSCGDILRHLAGMERYMFVHVALERPIAYPGHDRTLASGLADTLAYHDRLRDESRALLAGLQDADLALRRRTPAGASISLAKWLRAMLEHEAHHRGQLYYLLGMRGIVTPPLFGLTSEELRTP